MPTASVAAYMAFRMLALWEYGRTVKILMWLTFPVTAIGAFASVGVAIKVIHGAYKSPMVISSIQ